MGRRVLAIIVLTLLSLQAIIASALTLNEIKTIASSPESGDALLIWVAGGFYNPPYVDERGVTRQECTWPGLMAVRNDGTTIWIEPNFWNIVSGDGENYMRFINSTDEVAFYVRLNNVTTQWGGIAWATPGVTIVGRVPPQFAQLPAAGGYPWFSLPMKVKDFIANYDELYVKISYELVMGADTLVRYGLLMWFEGPNGNALAEVYVALHDDFGGWVGDKTVVKNITVPMIVDGKLLMGEFEVQRALSGGGWAAMVFLLKNADITKGTVVFNLKPYIEEVFKQMTEFFGINPDDLVWSNIAAASYAGSRGSGFEFGWILHDARLVPPELSPKIVPVTVTETTAITRTVTAHVTETAVSTVTSIETATVPTTAYQPDYITAGAVGIVLLIVGLLLGMFAFRKKGKGA